MYVISLAITTCTLLSAQKNTITLTKASLKPWLLPRQASGPSHHAAWNLKSTPWGSASSRGLQSNARKPNCSTQLATGSKLLKVPSATGSLLKTLQREMHATLFQPLARPPQQPKMLPASGSFRKSVALVWTPNSRALITRTPTKRTPKRQKQPNLGGHNSAASCIFLGC